MINPIVTPEWLAERRESVVVADVRWYSDGRSGHTAFLEGHLPGAVFVDLERWLSGSPSPSAGRHPLPNPETFAEGMSGLGIGDDDVVVAYDDLGGVFAARFVWMLRALGHAAALLDGGLTAWAGELESGTTERLAAAFTTTAWPDEVLATIDDASTAPGVLIDARPFPRYRGEPDSFDPRAGHIPGARSLPCREHLGANGRLLDLELLKERFAAVGIEAGTAVISYCGSGVTACHNLLVLEHVGLGTGRLYPGSWSQWANNPDRPIATGELPG